MRAFSFRLQGALEWRRLVERKHRLALAQAQAARRDEKRRREEAAVSARRAAQGAAASSGPAFRLWRQRADALLASAARRSRRIVQLNGTVRSSVDAVLQAAVDRAVLERLRQRRRALYDAEMGRRDQAYHDELGRLSYEARRAGRRLKPEERS